MAKRVKKILDEAHEMMKNGKDLKMGESLKSKDEDSKDKDSKDKSS